MIGQQWVRGVTAHELAAEWEMPVATVESDSSDAGKFIELCLDPAEVRRHSMVNLRRIAESGEPVAVRAIEIALKATGNLTERVDVNVTTRTTPDMFAAALEHEPFRAYLLEQGWRPPKGKPLLTQGVST